MFDHNRLRRHLLVVTPILWVLLACMTWVAYNYPEVAELVHEIGSKKIVVFTNPQEQSFQVGELFIYGLMIMIFYPLLGLILSLRLYKPS